MLKKMTGGAGGRACDAEAIARPTGAYAPADDRTGTWRRHLRLLVALVATVVATSVLPLAQASASPTTLAFPFKYEDCNGLWFKMQVPREPLREAVPDRYDLRAPKAGVALPLPTGTLYIQTDRCTNSAGRKVTVSRVSVAVDQPAFDAEQVPAQHDVDKPVGDHWEYYYLLGFVVSERDSDLRGYLAGHGLPVFVGDIDAVLPAMGAQPTGHTTPRVRVQGPDWLQYDITAASSSMHHDAMHEHISSYYHDAVTPDGQVRTARMVIDSLAVDWDAACHTTTENPAMAEMMRANIAPANCWVMEGPATWIDVATLD